MQYLRFHIIELHISAIIIHQVQIIFKNIKHSYIALVCDLYSYFLCEKK